MSLSVLVFLSPSASYITLIGNYIHKDMSVDEATF
jgi:hypothetical protein